MLLYPGSLNRTSCDRVEIRIFSDQYICNVFAISTSFESLQTQTQDHKNFKFRIVLTIFDFGNELVMDTLVNSPGSTKF